MARAADTSPMITCDQAASTMEALSQALTANNSQPIRLVMENGRQIELPEPVVHALRTVVTVLAAGDTASIVPVHCQLTTNEAAGLLHVSRPFLISLLEKGIMPYTKTGTHRRVRLADVLAYKERRDIECTRHLDAILAEGQATGTYF